MTKARFSVALAMMAMMTAFASGCTITLPEHGRPLSVGPATNPTHGETAPSKAVDDRTASR